MTQISSVVGSSCSIQPKINDDWRVIPNLWGAIIANPGEMKTPAIQEAIKPLVKLESKAFEDFSMGQKTHEIDLMESKAKRDAEEQRMKKAVRHDNSTEISQIKNRLQNMSQPASPMCRRYQVNDSTVAKLSEIMAQNQRGLLYFRDELIALLSSLDKEGNEADRAFFLETWNGNGNFTTDRIGRGTIRNENLCLSILGGIQPQKLESYLFRAIKGGENDGLIQRFQMMVYPDRRKTWHPADFKPDLQARERVSKIIETLANLDFTNAGAITNGTMAPHFQFDSEAQTIFFEWWTQLETEKITIDDQPIIIEHLSKYRKLMPSLALLFHLVDVADGRKTGQVSKQATILAVQWCNYLEGHARRIYSLVGSVAVQAARKLADKIKAGHLKDEFTIRDVYRKEWVLLEEKELIKKACDELVEAGWLQMIEQQAQSGGHKVLKFIINPKIKELKLGC
ncbi:MAG: DUF3987 domain-containing protein [Nitrospirae bacterium]|nr:DUF3987 domain-containing protein [Nitrospirota bacterium]MBI3352295.1 DUF3987 domain-containing protein [Nitrospirota bacterium]